LKTSRDHRIAQVLLWVTPALWSSNYIIARTADGVIAPNALSFGRWSLALLLMLPFAAGTLFSGFAQWRHEWKQMLVLGALGMWICGVILPSIYLATRSAGRSASADATIAGRSSPSARQP
jgi:drug/metabolite transporter (DMT)-like permease